ncbi:uncharacterized protein AAHN32_011117 [Aegotheles albertisi]
MFPPRGCRRGFPWEPRPWQAGPPPPHAHEPPWEHRRGRGRGGWCLPSPWDPRPFPVPDNLHGMEEEEEEEEMRWTPHDRPPPHLWDDREDIRGLEDCFIEGWHPGPPAGSREVSEPPRLADSPRKSPATDSLDAADAAVPEQAAAATLVEPGAGQKPTGTHGQSPSALEASPGSPEESSAGMEEHCEVELCSPSVPEAGAGGGSHPHAPMAAPEPAQRPHAVPGSAAGVDVEHSQDHQWLPSGAGDAEVEAAHDGLLSGLQPSENSQVLPGATTEPDTEPSQAGSDLCTAPETSPGTGHRGSGETEPAAGGGHWLSSTLPMPIPASTDLRSAAVLARKEEIELSYQQFSLTIAVVATMLLQKEPSMEAALGLALRANLRQGRIHHLQELEDFINSYDAATLSH